MAPKKFRNLIIGLAIAIPVAIFVFWDRYEPPTEPTDPAAIEAKRFAHSIKLPDSVLTAKYYPWWMGSESYFKFLCEHEAGEFIFKKIDNVEAIFQMRSREEATTNIFYDRYALEDPHGYIVSDIHGIALQFVGLYRQFETVVAPENALGHLMRGNYYKDKVKILSLENPNEGKYWRYFFTDEGKQESISAQHVETLKSRYGFTWRGIRRPKDRDLGIGGGELIVVDLQTKEVIGVRRGFARTGTVRNIPGGVNWEFASACPLVRRPFDGKLVAKDVSFTSWFILQVLRPASAANLK